MSSSQLNSFLSPRHPWTRATTRNSRMPPPSPQQKQPATNRSHTAPGGAHFALVCQSGLLHAGRPKEGAHEWCVLVFDLSHTQLLLSSPSPLLIPTRALSGLELTPDPPHHARPGVPGARAAAATQAQVRGHVPPAAVVLHNAVRGEGPQASRQRPARPAQVLADHRLAEGGTWAPTHWA